MVTKTIIVMDACRELVEVEVPASEPSARIASTMNEQDADRLELLDRLEQRVPDLDLSQRSVEWGTWPDDGSPALLIDGGGIDGGDGMTFGNVGEDVHAIGSTALLVPGTIGCVVIKPDGTQVLARVQPDPLAQQQPDS
jgi:hypothetical protein